MNAADYSAIRHKLLADRERIISELHGHRGLSGTADDWDLRDLEERAVQITSESVDRRIVDDDMKLLRKVEFALQRLDSGTYEKCDQCGAAIPIERLMAKPSVSLCLACQESKDALKS